MIYTLGVLVSLAVIVIYMTYNVKKRSYTIKKGGRGNPFDFALHIGKKDHEFSFTLDEGCMYPREYTDQVNKLFGWGYGHHHQNSVRLGWRPSDAIRDIELSLYTYKDGVRSIEVIGYIETNKVYECLLLVRGNGDVYYRVEGSNLYKASRIKKAINPSLGVGYYLFPYFGGVKKASQDMKIRLWK